MSSDHPNVKAANVAKDRNFRVLEQCHNNSNDHGKGKRNDRQRYRYCDAFELLRDSIEWPSNDNILESEAKEFLDNL